MKLHAQQQLEALHGKAVWLSSYPKSGNTWMRAFFTALFYEKWNINFLLRDLNIYRKDVFEEMVSLEASYLTPKEVISYRKDLLELALSPAYSNRLLFLKTHDNFTNFIDNINTHSVIYIVRNPLSVLPSLVHHNHKSIDETLDFMMQEDAGYAVQKEKSYHLTQFEQYIGAYNQHIENWLNADLPNFQLIRYEDLKREPFRVFSGIVKRLGLRFSDEEIQQAIENSSFKKLKKMEETQTFLEKNPKASSFFRKGKAEGWKEELTKDQIIKVIEQHGKAMQLLGYSTKLEDYFED